jgi:general secretion pathway protein D
MISLHFEDADLEVVLRALADLAKVNIVLGQGVKAKVTMWIERVPASEAFTIMQAILEANNLAAVKSGPVYKIVPTGAAAQQSSPIAIGVEPQAGEEGFHTQIVPLQYLGAEDLVRILTPLIAPGRVLAYKETNSIIMSAGSASIRRMLQVIQSLDVPGRQREVQQTFVYYLENAKAKELATVLGSIFEGRRDRAAGPAPDATRIGPAQPPQPPAQPPRPGGAAPPEPTPAPGAPGAELARVVGEVRIVADEPTNALIIRATAQDYRLVEETIKKLDILPKQVLIEALVAEISLTDQMRFGLEYFVRTGGFAIQQFATASTGVAELVQGAALASRGFTLSFVDSESFKALLTSLSLYTTINTLATPHILTLNNREAKIQVGQEVPVVTGSQATITGLETGGNQVFQTIQQRNIGRILGIKPHVNEKREVTLDIQLEVTDTLPSTTVTGTPAFSKRAVQTSVVVQDGQSLLIGGIISDNRRNDQEGIPWLSRIPVLKYLFGTVSNNFDRTELFIMLTPRVVSTPEEGRTITEEFRRRLEWMDNALRRTREPGSKPSW